MKKFFVLILIFFSSSCLKKWTYEGSHGPSAWGDITEDYKFCKIGFNQSPIDLNFEAKENDLKFSYSASDLEIERSKDGIKDAKFVFDTKDFLTTARKKKYRLQQIAFHHPSEHKIKGQQQILEMQITHRSEDEQLAILGIFIKVGKENSEFNKLIKLLENEKKKEFSLKFDLSKVVNSNDKIFFYEGSNTTPPCKEGVKWYVMKSAIELSKEQINKIIKMALNNKANARDTQKFAPEKY